MLSLRDDTKFARLAILLESDIARMASGQAARVAGNDDARMDADMQQVSYYRAGSLLWEARYEAIGTLDSEFQAWRWWWANKVGPTGSPRLDVAYGQVQQQQIPTLIEKSIRVETEKDASWLAHVMARLARADGVLRIREGTKATFVALFDNSRADRPSQLIPVVRPSERALGKSSEHVSLPGAAPDRPSVLNAVPHRPPTPGPGPQSLTRSRPGNVSPMPGRTSISDPASAPSDTPPFPQAPRAAMMSLLLDTSGLDSANSSYLVPGVSEGPRNIPLREPHREVFLPVAQQVMASVDRVLLDGCRQALFVIYIDTSSAKARFSTTIVGIDGQGLLQVIDTSRELLEATARMISDDARSGNGRWHRLVARFSRGARGASVDVRVTA